MPAVTPAEVHTLPSRTKIGSGSTSIAGYLACNSLARAQWVVTRRPSSRPGRGGEERPRAHGHEPSARVARLGRRSRRGAGRRTPRPPRRRRGAAARRSGRSAPTTARSAPIRRPLSATTSPPSTDTTCRRYLGASGDMWASASLAPANTSCGPVMSSGCTPSKATITTARGGSCRAQPPASLLAAVASMTRLPRIPPSPVTADRTADAATVTPVDVRIAVNSCPSRAHRRVPDDERDDVNTRIEAALTGCRSTCCGWSTSAAGGSAFRRRTSPTSRSARPTAIAASASEAELAD